MPFNAQTEMFLIEKPRRDVGFYHREFIVDCPHATSSVVIGNYPTTDAGRASGIFSALLKQHRETVAAAVASGKEDEICSCQPKNSKALS